jgi:hypothetical protein
MSGVCLVRRIEIDISELNFSARAFLLEDEAPKTCEAVWQALPIEGKVIHTDFSGMMLNLALKDEALFNLPRENEVKAVRPRDITYWYSYWVKPGLIRGMDEFAEIGFIYGRAHPRNFWDEEIVNLFAILEESSESFMKLGKTVRRTGEKEMIMRKV